MNVSVLCSSSDHPVWPYLEAWRNEAGNEDCHISLHNHSSELDTGDILFLVSCGEIISEAVRSKFVHCMVLHASDLPEGKGWSPYIWDVLNGANELVVSLLEADKVLDGGVIYHKIRVPLTGTELLAQIHKLLFHAEIELMNYAIRNFEILVGQEQGSESSGYYRLRSPADSEIDVNRTLAEQFNLLRVVDNERFPAFFHFRGKKFKLVIDEVFDEGSE